MAAPRKLPDIDTLKAHVEAGETYAQIAERYGATRSAVGVALRGTSVRSARSVLPYKDTIPWTIAVEHNDDVLVRRLRLLARRKAGTPMPPSSVALLDQWLAYMDEHAAVVTYDREHGFRLSKRRQGDGEYVRP